MLAIAVGFALFGCVQQPAQAPTPPAASPSSSVSPSPQYPDFVKVSISSGGFAPLRVEVARGGTVEWTNLDSQSHDVFFYEGPESPLLQQSQSWSYVFNELGEFAYYDSITGVAEGVVAVK